MDDKLFAMFGVAAGVTLAGRGLRPVIKLGMRGVVAAADATTGARHDLAKLYAEAKAEQRGATADVGAAAPPPAA